MGRQKYPLIVFCGMDGSGKTTLAKKVVEFFKERNQKCEFIHAHVYSISKHSFGLNEKLVNKLRFFLKLAIPFALLDNLYTYYFKYKPVLRNMILVCDRYFYDKIARMMYYEICSESVAKIYLKLLPKPDYVFFLDIDPKQAYSRKEEYSEREYNSFRNIYGFIAGYLKAPVLDTSLPLDVCSKQMLKHFSGLQNEGYI
ncbi:MAG: hypothetical protein J7J51_05830 [Candidatus Omnitrophica bacterium]|nr:hypothetical protein [Candidatus Omnitrophota bacterium]